MFTRTKKRIFFFLIYIISTRGKTRVKAFWCECSPFSSPSMRLFSSTYRIRVKGEGKKAKNSGRARRYAHARNANKTFVYAFPDKNGGNKRGTVTSRTERTRRPGAQRPKTTHRKASESLSDVFVCQRQGEERELKPKGISGGVLIEQCVVLSSSVVHVVLCRVDGCGHLHSVLQLLIG